MRNSAFKYLSIIVLMVSRLILGEFAHAMPHESDSAARASATTTAAAPHCPEHGGAQSQVQLHYEVADTSIQHDASTHDTEKKDCCNNGDCKCPCAHLTAMGVPSLAVSDSIDETRVTPAVAAPAIDRLSSLFRPPA